MEKFNFHPDKAGKMAIKFLMKLINEHYLESEGFRQNNYLDA